MTLLKHSGVTFHLSELKGLVMDRLKKSDFLDTLTGKIYLNQYDALNELDPNMVAKFFEGKSK